MLHRELIVDASTQTSDSQTYEKDLPQTGVLTGLNIIFKATNGATSNKDSPIEAVVSKIEVIGNGSEVIYSATGRETIALAWSLMGHKPYGIYDETGSAVQVQSYPIFFGRTFEDKSYGLDLSRWDNVKLKITYNLGAVNSVGATGFVSGSASITVVGYRYPAKDGVVPSGYLKTSEIKSFTTAASGDIEVDMPLMHKYRYIMVYCREDGVADGTDITTVKLSLNNDEEIPFYGHWEDIAKENLELFGINTITRGRLFKSDTDTFYTYGGTVETVNVREMVDVDITNDTFVLDRVDTVAGDKCTINSSQADVTAGSEDLTAYTTDHDIRFIATHKYPCNNIIVPIDRLKDMSVLLDSTAYGDIDLVLTQGGAGGTAGVVLQELVTK